MYKSEEKRFNLFSWNLLTLVKHNQFITGFVFVVVKIGSEGMMSVNSACKEGNKMMGIDNGKYVRYTPEQVDALERFYHECPKPTSMRRQQLIRECPILSNIDPKQIKVWFQNRRYTIHHFVCLIKIK